MTSMRETGLDVVILCYFVQILERPLSWSVDQGRLSVWGFQINLGASHAFRQFVLPRSP